MSEFYNFYCDESLHLPNDHSKIMVLGGIWCPKDKAPTINKEIREIKSKHGIRTELKWVKLSSSKYSAYEELINYFFSNNDLHFRILIIDNKDAINHELHHQTHDEWYYKMYFQLIKTILNPSDIYNIYLDIKDTKSKSKVKRLKDILNNSKYTISDNVIQRIQVVRSDEIEIMQIVDILIGAAAYKLRGLNKMKAKNDLIEYITNKSGYDYSENTLYRENKFNIFHIQLAEDESNELQK